jgi:hypothetical protein
MNRVEEFKILRMHKRKCALILLLFILITFTGILVTDYCLNGIVKNEKKVEVLQVENKNDNIIKLDILNKEINLKCSGVINDFVNLKEKLLGWSRTLLK